MDTNPTARSAQSPSTSPRENPTSDASQVSQHTAASIRSHSAPVVTGRIPHSSPASAMTLPPQNNNMGQTNSVTGTPRNTSNTERGPRTKRAKLTNQETLAPQRERNPRYEKYYAFIRKLNENGILAELPTKERSLLSSIELSLMNFCAYIDPTREISLESFDDFVFYYAATEKDKDKLDILSHLRSLPRTLFIVAKNPKTPYTTLTNMVQTYSGTDHGQMALATLFNQYPCKSVLDALEKSNLTQLHGIMHPLLINQANAELQLEWALTPLKVEKQIESIAKNSESPDVLDLLAYLPLDYVRIAVKGNRHTHESTRTNIRSFPAAITTDVRCEWLETPTMDNLT